MKSKKILIVVIIIIAMLAVGGGVFAYVYIATDTFRSDKELFSKYIYQNIEILQNLGDSQTIQKYKSLENEKIYEANTDVKVVYSEGGEVSNPINNLAARLDIQKNADDKYFYMDGQILFNDEEYLESEIIKDQELYGIRFSDVAKQFVTVKDDSNLGKIASDIGTDTATLQNLIDIIDGSNTITNELITQDDMKSLKEKYSNMIIETISKGTFNSNRKAVITYNNNTIKAKSYTVSISNDQVESLLIQILNSLKTETAITKKIDSQKYEDKIDEEIKLLSEEKEVPGIKITVYEHNANTIRTVVEIGEYKIIIENSEEVGQVKSNISINKVTSEQTEEYDIELTKETKESKEDVSLEISVVQGEQNYTVSILTETSFSDEDIELSATASYKKDILTASIKLDNTIKLKSDFDKKVKLENANNVTLNDMEDSRRKNIIESLKSNVPQKVQKRVDLLKKVLELTDDDNTDEEVPEYELSKTDINAFNAKFEFFTGNEVSADNVKSLLDVVKDNLGSYEIKIAEDQENVNEINEDKIRYNIKLNIERNKKNEDGINEVLAKIKDQKKYNVSIYYKEQNQLIDYITIEEVKE